MSENIHIRVSLAVLLIDDFTGRIITSSGARATVPDSGKPVIKKEGFHVFTNLTDPVIRISAKGPCYCEEERLVDIRKLDPANPVVRVRMTPNRWYALPSSAVRTEVKLPADTELFVFSQESSNYKRLLSDYRKGSDEISLYQGDMEELEEKACCIAGKDGIPEPLRLGTLKQREQGIYRLEMCPSGGYKKMGTRVYPASYLPAGDTRTCFLPLKSYGKKEITYTFLSIHAGTQTVTRTVLQTDRENRIDLEGEMAYGAV